MPLIRSLDPSKAKKLAGSSLMVLFCRQELYIYGEEANSSQLSRNACFSVCDNRYIVLTFFQARAADVYYLFYYSSIGFCDLLPGGWRAPSLNLFSSLLLLLAEPEECNDGTLCTTLRRLLQPAGSSCSISEFLACLPTCSVDPVLQLLGIFFLSICIVV